MSSQKNHLAPTELLTRLSELIPGVEFVADDAFTWSPATRAVHYQGQQLNNTEGQARLLHESGHALCNHTTYISDFSLLQMELDAWEKAKVLAQQMGLRLPAEFIEDCLDTYRDWLHRRSTCPTCGSVSMQQSSHYYRCHNCMSSWNVTAERFCRPYRRLTPLPASA